MTEAAVMKDVPPNPCCALWKDKLSKLQQKCTKLEEGRTALRRGIELYARQVDQMQTEITNLKKACEEERSHTENERKEKVKQSATRVSLENEISVLKSEISSLRQREGLKVDYANEELMLVLDCDETEMNRLKEQLQEAKTEVDLERKKAQEEKKRAEDALKNINVEKLKVDKELNLLQSRFCDKETEINLLTKHLQEEKIRVELEEKKKAEAEKKADESCENVKEEKMRAKTEMNRLKEQLQEAKTEVDSERKKSQEEKKRAEDALKNINVEKLKVDKELTLLQSRICDKETEINLLTKHLQEEKIRVGLEEKKKAEAEKKADEACENAKEAKMRADEELTLLRSLVCENESEINLLREQLREVRIKASQEEKKAEAEKKKIDEALENGEVEKLRVGEELTLLRSLVSEKETEINLLREQLQKVRIRVDSEGKKKADEACESAKREQCRVKGLLNDEEREDLSKESMRLRLEDEISSLKSHIQEEGSRAENVNEELALLRVRVSEGETKINRLKELLEEERIRADSEKKKAEADKKNANEAWEMVKEEKYRVDKERMIVDSERKKATEYRLQLENLKVEADEARSKLVIETLKCEEANIKLEAERQHMIKEQAKAEKLGKLAEISKSNALEEKCRADRICQQLEEDRQRFEKLKKEMEELQSSRQMVEIPVHEPVKRMNGGDAELRNGFQMLNQEAEESNSEKAERRLVEANQKADLGKKGCDLEMRKSVEHRSVAEAYRKKAFEEKSRADKLTQQLEENRRLTEDLRKEMELVSSKKLLEPSLVHAEKNTSAEMRLLRKELKLEKSRVKHAKQVAKLEKSYKNILEQELYRIKTEFTQFSHRLELGNCCTNCNVGIGHPAKNGCSNSKRKRVSSESRLMHLPCSNEQLRPSCAYMDASDCLKQSIDCSTPMLGNQTESTSGIASKLQPLLRGSNRKTLHSSAIDSSMASFSDNPLVGSQARGAFSVSKSAEWAEEKLKSQFPIPRLSGEVNGTQYNKAVMKNGVRNPLDGVRRVWHSENGERILNTAELAEYSPADKKWHPEIVENACMLHHVLQSQMDKPSNELGCLLNNLQDNLHAHKDQHQKKIFTVSEKEEAMIHLHNSNVQKDDLGTKAIEGADVYLHTSPLDNAIGTAQTCKDYGKIYLECFDKVVKGDYMRLLDLDDTSDEESYRLAIERPLSPTLPEIEFRSSEAIETDVQNHSSIGCFLEELSDLKSHTAPRASDTMNERIDSDLSKLDASEILDSLEISKFYKNRSDTMHTGSACQIQDSVVMGPMGGISSVGDKGSKILFDSNSGSTHDTPLYCVVFSNFEESSSLSKIFCTTRTLKNQRLVLSQVDHLVKRLMAALLEIDDLVPKEKVCVFFSMLLDHCYWNFKNHIDGDFAQFLDFSVRYVMKVMSELETRSILDELITLIEDFLIDRRVLVHVHGTQPSTRVAILNVGDINLSFQTASYDLLMCGAIALAALCTEFDCVGFLCEASYNIARGKKLDSFVSTILHVFAYICGNKYFALNDYSLVMTVIKSLVTFLENESRCTPASFHRSIALGWSEFPVCVQCPFYEGALSIDELTALLLEKLLSFNCLHNFGGLTCKSHTDFGGTLCKLADVLSLLELTASNMSWEWTCNNIVGRLLTVLESPVVENGLTACLILLGQLLRIGIEANGLDDSAVENIKCRLCAFLSQSTAREVGLPVQIATVSALLGMMPLSFEEVIESSTALPESSSLLTLVDCVRKWYSLLSNEHKPLSCRLLKADMPSGRKGVKSIED